MQSSWMTRVSEEHRREGAFLSQTLPFFVVFLGEKHPTRASATFRVLLCTLGERRGYGSAQVLGHSPHSIRCEVFTHGVLSAI